MLRRHHLYSPRFTSLVFFVPDSGVLTDLLAGFNQWQNVISGHILLFDWTNFRTTFHVCSWNGWHHRLQPYMLASTVTNHCLHVPRKISANNKNEEILAAHTETSFTPFKIAHACHNSTKDTAVAGLSSKCKLSMMEESKQRYQKRQRVPSGSEGCELRKRCVKKSDATQSKHSNSDHQRNTPRYVSGLPTGQGFTRHNWPQSAQDCEWRRAAQEAQATAASRNLKYVHGIRKQTEDCLTMSENHPFHNTNHNQHCPSLDQSAAMQRHVPKHGLTKWQHEDFKKKQTLTTQPHNAHADKRDPGVRDQKFRRQWLDCQHGKHQPHIHSIRPSQDGLQGFEFSIVSYNILAQCLLESNRHLYNHCQEHVLQWEHRKWNLIQELTSSGADIICLQEVENRHLRDFFQPEMEKLDYAVIYKKRTGDKKDGCATFYKVARFEEVQRTEVEFQRGANCLDRDNVAVIVMLHPIGLPSYYQLCVANTHLLWNPRRGDVKLAQLGVLFAEIDKVADTANSHHHYHPNAHHPSTYHPIIICGDFNSIPHCPLYKFVNQGTLHYDGMAAIDISGQEQSRSTWNILKSPLWPHHIGITDRCQYLGRSMSSEAHAMKEVAKSFSETIAHPFNFSSVYDHHHGNQEVTTNHARTNCIVDYIFYTKMMGKHTNQVSKGASYSENPSAVLSHYSSNLSLVKKLSLFTDTQVSGMGGLPNSVWSSDHFSLQAKLLLTPLV